MVFTGAGEPRYYAADEEDYIIVGRGTVELLGSFEAIIAHFDAAEFKVPPLLVEGDRADEAR